jgi:hypothetical protein
MKSSILFVAGLLSLSSFAFASKTYEISLAHETNAGGAKLKAGHYTVKVNNGVVFLTNVGNGEEYMVGVKMQTAAKKFDQTHVDSDSNGSVDNLKDIQLGGTTTEIEFE